MVDFSQQGPKRGRQILHAALRKRFHRTPTAPVPRGLAQTGTPLPVYRLTPQAAAQKRPLGRARRVGWRSPVLTAEGPALAYLRQSTRGLEFGGVAEGILPKRLFEAATLAEREFAA